MKSCALASRTVSKTIEIKAEAAEKEKKMVMIIDDDGFIKVVNTQSSPSATPEPGLKTLVPQPRIVELVLD